MSFQACLDTIEESAGLTPRQFVEGAGEKGFADPPVKAGTILEWRKEHYGLGRGHGMALVQVIENSLVVAHFSPLTALPAAVYSLWHNISGALVAAWLARRPLREA